MVVRVVLAASQAIAGVVEPKLGELLALAEPMPRRAQRRRTLGKTVLPVEPRGCSDRSAEPLLSSSRPFPPKHLLLPVSPLTTLRYTNSAPSVLFTRSDLVSGRIFRCVSSFICLHLGSGYARDLGRAQEGPAKAAKTGRSPRRTPEQFGSAPDLRITPSISWSWTLEGRW
jgi:hypothetical protein